MEKYTIGIILKLIGLFGMSGFLFWSFLTISKRALLIGIFFIFILLAGFLITII